MNWVVNEPPRNPMAELQSRPSSRVCVYAYASASSAVGARATRG